MGPLFLRGLPALRIAAAVLLATAGAAFAATPALSADHAPIVSRPGFAPLAPPPGSFTVLSYHEVRDETRNYPDPYAVDSAALVAQFAWLRGNGYTPVSLSAIIDARHGGAPLPDKAVLLSFDDGYLSFYTRVYPLLRQYHYPALMAVVGKWIQDPGNPGGGYGENGDVPDASFPTWAQIREMTDSGLVEVASHTYDMHHGVLANAQNNLEPSATTRIYDPATNTTETDAHWRERVRADMQRNSDLIAFETGHRPRAIVWPYGSYSEELIRIAGEVGMPVDITLDDGVNTPQVPLTAMRRLLVIHNPTMADFAGEVTLRQVQPVRAVEVSLDQVYDPDPAQEEKKLSVLLDRVQALGATHVFLHAFSDAGVPQAYFRTGRTSVRGDLFNRVAWQLATRTDVDVYAALPPSLLRMAPNDADALVADLARDASFEGIYFMPPAPGQAVDPAALDAASTRLTAAARQWRAPLKIARGIEATGAAPPLITALSAGADFVVLADTAAPPAGIKGNPEAGSSQPRLVVLFDGTGSGKALADRMRAVQRAGVINFGYREENFMQDQPPLAAVAPALSVRDTIR